MITKRDPDVKHERLLEEQVKMIDWLIDSGFKPSWNDETNKANLGDVAQPVQTASPAQSQGLACGVCGALATQKSGISKANKPYNGIFCSTKDSSHTVWL